MKPNKKAPKAKRRKISFSASFPNANRVVLMGEFNGWNAKKHAMSRSDDGVWEKSLLLYPGTYEYKFLVDGGWQNDPENPFNSPNCFGTRNNFIIVKET